MEQKERYVLWWKGAFDAWNREDQKLGVWSSLADLVMWQRSWKTRENRPSSSVTDDKFIIEVVQGAPPTVKPRWMGLGEAKMLASDELDGAMKALWKAILTRR